jgi:hypothetical protein
MSDPAKYIGRVSIRNQNINKSFINSCQTQPNILAGFRYEIKI